MQHHTKTEGNEDADRDQWSDRGLDVGSGCGSVIQIVVSCADPDRDQGSVTIRSVCATVTS